MFQFDSTIFLIGATGAGKTTVGRLLASKLKCTFYDLDAVIEERCGANIPWIFDVEGESGFRNRETKALYDLCDLKGVVISTGAGVILREKNQLLLKRHQPFVVWLNVDLRTQFERIKYDQGRPLLQVADPQERLKKMADEREPLYRSCAGITVKTGRTSPSLIVKRILQQLEKHHANIDS